MAKKKFASPFLILSGLGDPGDDEVIGGGSGQSGQEAWLCDFDDWCIMFFEDVDGDTDIDEYDYYLWFKGLGGDDELFASLNPGMPVPPPNQTP